MQLAGLLAVFYLTQEKELKKVERRAARVLPHIPLFFCRPRGPARKLSLGDVAAARGREKATTGTCDFSAFFSRFFFPIVNDFF